MSLLEISTNNNLRVSLIAGIASSSYFFLANLGASAFGIIPAALEPALSQLSIAARVELWSYFYGKAKYHFAGSTIISAVSFTTAACFSSSTPSLRKLCLLAAGCSSLVLPFTAVAMLPLNNEITAIHDSGDLQEAAGEETPKHALLARTALGKIDTWRRLHRVRMFLGAGAWACGLATVGYNF